MYIAQYDTNGFIIALHTIDEYLELPQSAITEVCGALSLI